MEQRNKAILSAVSLTLFSLVMIAVMLWLFPQQIQNQIDAIRSDRQLIVLSESNGYAPGLMLFLVVMCAFCAKGTVFLTRSDQSSVRNQSFTKVYSTLLMVAFFIIFVGHYLINSYFKSQMAAKGYQQCPASTLLFTRVTYSAWTLNPALCYDADVKRIVLRGSSGESEQVEQMLQQRARQQEARRKFLLQEEQIKQQRQQRMAEQ